MQNLTRHITGPRAAPFFVPLITGLLLFSMAPQQPLYDRLSLLDRAGLGMAVLSIVLFFTRTRLASLVIPLPLVGLLGLMGISIAQMPQFFIVKDFLAFVLLFFFAVIAIAAGGMPGAIRGVALAGVLLALLTTLYAFFLPHVAFEPGGQLRGAFGGSNSLAISLVLTIPAVICFSTRKRWSTFVFRSVTVVWIGVEILMSTSKTSLIVFIALLAIWLILWLRSKSKKIGVFALAALGLAVTVALANWTTITHALGKSSDLSGRFPLWEAYLSAIAERPLQGYGWHVITTPDMALGQFIHSAFGHDLNNANNDLLNWWALTGFLGPVVALVLVLSLIAGGLFIRRLPKSHNKNWVFLTGSLMFLLGLTELSTMHPDGWLITSLASVALGTILHENGTLSRFGTALRRLSLNKVDSTGHRNTSSMEVLYGTASGMDEGGDGHVAQLPSYGIVAQSRGTVSTVVGCTMGVICASSTFVPGVAATTSKVRFWVAPGANSTR
ncbi:MAG: O-antigen ligase family protein, partial [Actinomycetales bacterium]|nr:O-antigen ligase family protein [Actinomycetales bacterium]